MEGDPIQEFRDWYASRPIFARTFLTISTLMAVAHSLGFINLHSLYYTYEVSILHQEFWRLFTGLFFLGDIGVGFIFEAYCGYIVLYFAEKDLFERKNLADYLMLSLFIYIIITIGASLVDVYFLCDSFFFALLFVESRFKPYQEFRFVMKINVPVKYFIWVYLGFNVLMGSSIYNFVFGFIAGFLYVQIKTNLLRKSKIDFWPTPSILKSVVEKLLQWTEPRIMQQEDANLEEAFE